MSEHTPGPWERESLPGEYDTGIRAHGENVSGYVAFLNTRWEHKQQQQEQEANARLIAAAPDLLEACKALPEFNVYNADAADFKDHAAEFISAMMLAQSAIARAEGE